MRPPERLETERLLLRRPGKEDARGLFESYARDPVVTRWLSWEPHEDIARTEEFLARCDKGWREAGAFAWVIENKSPAGPIGMIELRLEASRADCGYVLARKHWGKGIMPEAVRALKEWTLGQPELHRFWAVADVENVASHRVLEKAGLVREGVLRRWGAHGDAVPRDCVCYAAVKELPGGTEG